MLAFSMLPLGGYVSIQFVTIGWGNVIISTCDHWVDVLAINISTFKYPCNTILMCTTVCYSGTKISSMSPPLINRTVELFWYPVIIPHTLCNEHTSLIEKVEGGLVATAIITGWSTEANFIEGALIRSIWQLCSALLLNMWLDLR